MQVKNSQLCSSGNGTQVCGLCVCNTGRLVDLMQDEVGRNGGVIRRAWEGGRGREGGGGREGEGGRRLGKEDAMENGTKGKYRKEA